MYARWGCRRRSSLAVTDFDRRVAGRESAPGALRTGARAEIEHLRDLASEAPIIRAVNLLIARALDAGASDIHVEPFEARLKVRYRIDGVLRDVEAPPVRSSAAVASRVKVMANLDIAERRLPQDGRIEIRVEGREVERSLSQEDGHSQGSVGARLPVPSVGPARPLRSFLAGLRRLRGRRRAQGGYRELEVGDTCLRYRRQGDRGGDVVEAAREAGVVLQGLELGLGEGGCRRTPEGGSVNGSRRGRRAIVRCTCSSSARRGRSAG